MFNPFRHTINLLPALAATAALAAVAAPTASASSTTYCVNDPSCTGTVEPSVQRALNKASFRLGPDTVQIGPGVYAKRGGFSYNSTALDNAVTIVGAGQGSTTLRIPGDPSVHERVLSVVDSAGGSRLTGLSIKIPGEPANNQVNDTGLALDGTRADHVTVGGAATANNVIGLVTFGASSFTRGTVTLPVASPSNTGVLSEGPTKLSLTTVKANTAFTNDSNSGASKLDRVTLSVDGSSAIGASTEVGAVSIKNSVIDLHSAAFGAGLRAANLNSGPGPKSIRADHVTVVGGGANSTGLQVLATAPIDNGSQLSTATLTNSTISGPAVAIDREARNTATTNPGTSRAIVKTDYSNYDQGTVIDNNGANGGGSTSDAHFVAGAPTFVGGGDLTPAPGSILIDAGDPTLAGGVDLAGNPRVADGDADGIAVTDLGAFERQP